MKRGSALCAAWLCSCAWPSATPAPTGGESLALADVSVFDGERWLDHQTVLVSGGRITAVGAADAVEVPSGTTVVASTGLTVLPGFIDAHVHLGFYPPSQVLAGGITTARDLAWPPDVILPLAQALAADPSAGPSLRVAGPMLTAAGGYPSSAGWAPPGTAREVSSVEEAQAAVDGLVSAGVDVIKVAQEPRGAPTLTPELLSAITQRAHQHGLKVVSHVGSLAELNKALDAGVDELAHGLWSGEALPEATLERMVAAGTVVIPTLHIDPDPQRLANLGALVARGGKVVYGTDMGNYGPPPGIDPTELSLMMQSGMSLDNALAAATSLAAEAAGLTDRGRIEVGRRADVIVVDGDPRRSLEVLGSPTLVMRQGVIAGR